MKRKQGFSRLLVLTSIVAATSCNKKDSTAPSSPGVYFPSVKIIMQNNCLSCHNSAGTWEGRPTKFDSDAEIAAQYAAIKAAVADPVTPTNRRMPDGGSLSSSDIDVIVKWYNKGGKVTD